MNWYKIAKYTNNISSYCGHCGTHLETRSITRNPSHSYPIGTNYVCRCGKSSLWTNSIRHEENLINFFEGKEQRYINGFCNDRFCGYCNRIVYPLQNGAKLEGHEQRFDRFGCKSCVQNQKIMVDGRMEDGEGDNGDLMMWYKNGLARVKSLMQ